MEFVILYVTTISVASMLGLFFLITTYKRIFDRVENPLNLFLTMGMLFSLNPILAITIFFMFPIFYYNYEQQFIPHIEDQHNIEVDGNDADDEG